MYSSYQTRRSFFGMEWVRKNRRGRLAGRLTGYDIDPGMVKIALLNMYLHGMVDAHSRFGVRSRRSEVLFVDYMAEHLTTNGRAGIIVTEGIIFQSLDTSKTTCMLYRQGQRNRTCIRSNLLTYQSRYRRSRCSASL